MSHNVVLKLKNKGKVVKTVELNFQTTTEETKRILGGSNELLDFELGLKRLAEVMDGAVAPKVYEYNEETFRMEAVQPSKREVERLRRVVASNPELTPVWTWH